MALAEQTRATLPDLVRDFDLFMICLGPDTCTEPCKPLPESKFGNRFSTHVPNV